MTRAIRILDFLGAAPSGLTAAEIAGSLGVPPATAHHLLNTLVDSGTLSKHARRYHLGPKIGFLGEAFFRSNDGLGYLVPTLDRLARETGETVYLSAWRHGEVVVLAVCEGHHPIKVAGPSVGFSGHAHARASGKVLLAALPPDALDAYRSTHELVAVTERATVDPDALLRELEQVRERGYALDDGEFKEGVSCLAAPVSVAGATVAAISLSAPTERFHRHADEYRAAVMSGAAAAASTDGGAPEQRAA